MSRPKLVVVSLRYSSWSIRTLVVLWRAGIDFELVTAEPALEHQGLTTEIGDHEAHVRHAATELEARRRLGSVNGNFPVLWVDGAPIHETLAICEWAAELRPQAGLWPRDAMARARARALSLEMATGFFKLRTHLSSHPLARVQDFAPDGPTRVEIARVHEIWRDTLAASEGPFLFGDFGIVDAMYLPVMLRFETYGVPIPEDLAGYPRALHGLPEVRRWRALANEAPRIPVYDAYIESLGGSATAAEQS